ncbi:NnrS family protein [Phaeobacter inhibens]|uniref:NnrS family protein n=1 Tax=Phaeobacter inhibens TaxID=221822 RepID=UPI0035CD2DC0
MTVTTDAGRKETNASSWAPAILSYGFRPFFFLAALWAGLAMIAWIGQLSGVLTLPIMLDPVSWHAKAFLFGYLSAVLAGFLLTAVPNGLEARRSKDGRCWVGPALAGRARHRSLYRRSACRRRGLCRCEFSAHPRSRNPA